MVLLGGAEGSGGLVDDDPAVMATLANEGLPARYSISPAGW
jgi:hypothetical protein